MALNDSWKSDPRCACKNVEETKKLCFFPEASETALYTNSVAKSVCEGCPLDLKDKCLEAGLNEAYGVWGGLDPKERAELRKQLAEDKRYGLASA